MIIKRKIVFIFKYIYYILFYNIENNNWIHTYIYISNLKKKTILAIKFKSRFKLNI